MEWSFRRREGKANTMGSGDGWGPAALLEVCGCSYAVSSVFLPCSAAWVQWRGQLLEWGPAGKTQQREGGARVTTIMSLEICAG